MKKWKMGCSSLLGLFVVATIARVVTGNQTPDIRVPAPPAPPRPNAFDTYQKAIQSVKRTTEVADALFDAQGKPRNPVAWSKRAELLAANADASRLAKVALTQTYYQPPIRSFEAQFPYLKQYRNLARLAALDGANRFAEGDSTGGAAACLDGIAMGQQIAGGGALIPRLVSVACQAVARRPLWQNLNRLNASDAHASAHRLEDLAARRIPFKDTLVEEKYTLQGSLGQVWSGKPRSVAGPSPSAEDQGWSNPPVPFLFYTIWSKREAYDNITGYMDALIAQSDKPYAERKPIKIPRDGLSRILLPVYATAAFRQTANEDTQTALLAVALALRAYRAENGALLTALPDVVEAGALIHIPADPFAPSPAPLRYRRTSANAYVLYSVGPDGVDDGGKAINNPAATTANKRLLVEPDSKGDIVAGVNVY